MGGVRQELALLFPGLFHRSGGPVGQQNGNAQQKDQRKECDPQVGSHHIAEDGGLHGHIHKGNSLIESVVLPGITQTIVPQLTLRLCAGQAGVQNILQRLRVFQIGIGAAGHIGMTAPDLHCEIGQKDPVSAGDIHADLRTAEAPFVERGVFQDLIQHLTAQLFHVPLHGNVDRNKDDRQNGGHQRHADGDKFQTKFSDHDK